MEWYLAVVDEPGGPLRDATLEECREFARRVIALAGVRLTGERTWSEEFAAVCETDSHDTA